MTLRLYDTATREVRDFVPLEEGKAGALRLRAHRAVGAARRARPLGGQLRRAAALADATAGYEVTFIRNVTDIDDKILVKAAEQGRPWYNLAYDDEARARPRPTTPSTSLPPTYEPRATGHVPEMLELIERLIERGHAYAAEDGSGDVYFDVRSWPAYGELTRQGIDDMEAAEDADPRGKRDPRDFALWKGAQGRTEPETASWPSAVGPGPPGLAHRVLGDGRQVPRRRLRHPRRRRRPALPAPRERAGPVARGRATRSRRTGCTTPGSPRPARR